MKITGTNVFSMADAIVENNGTIPARVPAVKVRHLKRCMEAGLLAKNQDGTFSPTEAGWEAIAADAWHATNLAALAFRPTVLS